MLASDTKPVAMTLRNGVQESWHHGAVVCLERDGSIAFSVGSPQAIVLFGGLTKAGDLILNPTRKAMEENLVQTLHAVR